MSSSYPPYLAYPSAPPLQRALPAPPRLHWGWVLALSVITFGIFASIWLLVQANWIRKMRQDKSTGFWLALANLLWLPLVVVAAAGVGIVAAVTPSIATANMVSMLDPIVRMGSFVLYICAVYVMRSEMEQEPIGIPLSGVMTFFFASFYFQYHLREFGTAYQAPAGLGLSAASSPRETETAPMAYPTPAQVGVVYPPASAPAEPPSA